MAEEFFELQSYVSRNLNSLKVVIDGSTIGVIHWVSMSLLAHVEQWLVGVFGHDVLSTLEVQVVSYVREWKQQVFPFLEWLQIFEDILLWRVPC